MSETRILTIVTCKAFDLDKVAQTPSSLPCVRCGEQYDTHPKPPLNRDPENAKGQRHTSVLVRNVLQAGACAETMGFGTIPGRKGQGGQVRVPDQHVAFALDAALADSIAISVHAEWTRTERWPFMVFVRDIDVLCRSTEAPLTVAEYTGPDLTPLPGRGALLRTGQSVVVEMLDRRPADPLPNGAKQVLNGWIDPLDPWTEHSDWSPMQPLADLPLVDVVMNRNWRTHRKII